MSNDDVIGAELLQPAFSADLSTWMVVIDRNGLLRQVTRVSNHSNGYGGELHKAESKLTAEALSAMQTLIDKINFRNFPDRLSTSDESGLETLSISIRYGGSVKAVELYGSRDFVEEGKNQDAVGFFELWEQIHKCVVYPSDFANSMPSLDQLAIDPVSIKKGNAT
jgi:hypothetical protein